MLPHNPPLPLGATFGLTSLVLDVTFDRPLTAGPVSGFNWTCDAAFFRYGTPNPGVALGSHVQITLAQVGATPDPDTYSYNAAPPDVLSSFGIPAAPFIDLPLVVLP